MLLSLTKQEITLLLPHQTNNGSHHLDTLVQRLHYCLSILTIYCARISLGFSTQLGWHQFKLCFILWVTSFSATGTDYSFASAQLWNVTVMQIIRKICNCINFGRQHACMQCMGLPKLLHSNKIQYPRQILFRILQTNGVGNEWRECLLNQTTN